MAQVDIAGLLTGIPSLQDPMTQGRINAANLPAGTSAIERELARQRPSNEARMRQSVGGLFSAISGTPVDLRTQGTRAREAIGQLDPNSPEYQAQLLTQLAKVDPMRAAGVRQQLNVQKAKQDKETQQKTAITAYIAETYPDQPALLELAKAGLSFKDIQQAAKEEEGADRYKVVGNNIYDTVEAKYIIPENNTPSAKPIKTTEYNAVEKINEVVFRDGIDPKKVLARFPAEQKEPNVDKLRRDITTANNLNRDSLDQADRATSLANKFDSFQNLDSGLKGNIVEGLKSIFGTQDYQSELKQQARALRNSAAIANLPRGPASDKDVQLVLEGEFDPNGNAEYFARYSRGIAKLAQAEAYYYSTTSTWLSRHGDNKGLNEFFSIERIEETLSGVTAENITVIKNAVNSKYTNKENTYLLNEWLNKYGQSYPDMLKQLERSKRTLTDLGRENF